MGINPHQFDARSSSLRDEERASGTERSPRRTTQDGPFEKIAEIASLLAA
jgi:hypothetical protein